MTAQVPSPCNKICQLDPARGYCIGCYRTGNEIAGWMGMSDAERLATLDRCGERRSAPQKS